MQDPRAVADILDAEVHQVAGAEFRVDGEVKKRQIPGAASDLQANPDGVDLIEPERGLLADQLSLVP
jgi:hypothetical protein